MTDMMAGLHHALFTRDTVSSTTEAMLHSSSESLPDPLMTHISNEADSSSASPLRPH